MIKMFDLIEWLQMLLYVETGIMFGILFRDGLKKPYWNDNELHLGTLGQILLGFMLSFGLQILGTDLGTAWLMSTSISTGGNIAYRLLKPKLTKMELRRKMMEAIDAIEEYEKMIAEERNEMDAIIRAKIKELREAAGRDIKVRLAEPITSTIAEDGEKNGFGPDSSDSAGHDLNGVDSITDRPNDKQVSGGQTEGTGASATENSA